MKFIADAMLGRLAKRLRLMGFDVLYDPGLDDNAIIQRSIDQDRIILTRDTALASRPLATRCVLVQRDHADEQLDQLWSLMEGIVAPATLTRCSVCNEPLEPAVADAVRDSVPSHVQLSQRTFFRCSECGRIYWKGSHVKHMELVPERKRKDRPGNP